MCSILLPVYYSPELPSKAEAAQKLSLIHICSYEQVKADVEKLSYLSDSGMMYLLLDGTVYGIDLRSNESMVVALSLIHI